MARKNQKSVTVTLEIEGEAYGLTFEAPPTSFMPPQLLEEYAVSIGNLVARTIHQHYTWPGEDEASPTN